RDLVPGPDDATVRTAARARKGRTVRGRQTGRIYDEAGYRGATYTDPSGLAECENLSGQEFEDCKERERPEQEERERTRACWIARGELVARGLLDVGLAVAYSSAAGLAVRGGMLLAEGMAIQNGIILRTTLASMGSTGAGEIALGRAMLAVGASEVAGVATA